MTTLGIGFARAEYGDEAGVGQSLEWNKTPSVERVALVLILTCVRRYFATVVPLFVVFAVEVSLYV